MCVRVYGGGARCMAIFFCKKVSKDCILSHTHYIDNPDTSRIRPYIGVSIEAILVYKK